MKAKVCDLREAVFRIPDGAVVGVGGNTNYRRPVTLALEIIAQGKKNLTVLAMTAGLACDLMVGAGCVSTVRTSYFGLEVFGFAPMFRRAVEAGSIQMVEETEMTVAAGLRATQAQLAFLPARVLQGTDMLKVRSDIKTVACPYTGEILSALPAIRPDVALIHALSADEKGNLILGGNLSIDIELAQTADLTIASTEALVSHREILRQGADVIGLNVDRLVVAPRGAYPTSCHPKYHLDGWMFVKYVRDCQQNGFDLFLDELKTHLEEMHD
jgi:glutaconate CoA-transferase subunit A